MRTLRKMRLSLNRISVF